MGDWSSATYIASQVVTLVAFSFLGISFLIKNRARILLLSVAFSMVMIASHSLLAAWVGVGMSIISILRNIVFWAVDSKKSEENKNRIIWIDWITITVFSIAMVVTTYFTQDGWMTWFGFMASIVFTLALWQKNVLVYRILGFLSSVCWVVFHIAIENLVGLIFESVLLAIILGGIISYFVGRGQVGRHKTSPSDTESLATD